MNVPQLPRQFAKLVALYLFSTFESERDVARRKAEAILPTDVGGFDRALRILAYEQARDAGGALSFMAGLDEFTEINDPGHTERRRAEHAETRRKQDARRTELVAEFGSLAAVIEPCAREKAMMDAVRPWRVATQGSLGRWTETIAGLGTYEHRQAPAEVTTALEAAWPMPLSYAEACAEAAFWARRNDDMELAVRDGFLGDYMLDTPALWRWWIVRDLAEHKMELRTVADIVERVRAYRQSESGTDREIEDAILRDLEALAAREVR